MRPIIDPRFAFAIVLVFSAVVSLTGNTSRASAGVAREHAWAMAPVPALPATTLVGDVDGDCRVDLTDLTVAAGRYLTAVGSLLYAPAYDLNHDGVINIADIQIIASHFGQRC